MEYKTTLNLPKTDFPMKAGLVAREPERLKKWEEEGIYQRIQAKRSNAPARFVLHDGPPFANGEVHIGTALNKALKDIIVKYKSLRGFQAPYVPGWDCHGLPIEFKVTQETRKKGGDELDPAGLRRACEEYARKFIDVQRTQFKRLGVFGDWDNPYLTLNKEYEAEELRLFADIVEKGFVYRGKKPVYWSIPCRTALAEAEVEYQDHVSQSVYVKFPVAGEPNMFLLIWTTTPWTLPANLAVAFNSTFSYSLVRTGEEAYLVSTLLLDAVAEKCQWEGYEIMRSLTGEDLQQLEYQHPFCERTGKLYAGDGFVDNTTGTGFVHIAPGHGADDYHLGRQNGLPIYSPVDDDGRLTRTSDLPEEQQMPDELVGKSILERKNRSEANEAVLELLTAKKRLMHREDYAHSYPHCWRSKTPVIFRAMDQWFIQVDHEHFRETALKAIDEVAWTPAWGKNRIEGAVKSRPDWCISRQRMWGVPIPAFYDEQSEPILDAAIVRKTADLFEKRGSNVWFEMECGELWKAVRPDGWAGPEPVRKSTDTLDVWIDSGSSSRAVLSQRKELHHDAEGVAEWQADMYLEGSDQHRGWFQSSLLLSLAGNGAPPFKTVLTHGFMVDADREKISKSKQGQGGYQKPQTSEAYIGQWGADIVRLWVASQDYRNDVIVSEERVKKVAETYRLLRNTIRFQLSNLFDFDPAKDALPEGEWTPLDRWVWDAYCRLEAETARAYDEYEFHVVYQRLSQFAAVELSAIYHDLTKDRLYTDAPRSARRRATQTVLHRMARGLCQMLSPILVFTSEEAWEFLPGEEEDPSPHLTEWKPSSFVWDESERQAMDRLFGIRDKVLLELETARKEKRIGKALEAIVYLKLEGGAHEAAAQHLETLRELLNVSGLKLLGASGGEDGAVAQELGGAPIAVRPIKELGAERCERCWHWETNVGSNNEHPTLCGGCVEAIADGA